MTKLDMIKEIVITTDDYTVEELMKLWHVELQILHHAVIKEGYRKEDRKAYELEVNHGLK